MILLFNLTFPCLPLERISVFPHSVFQYFLSNTANPGTFHDGSGIISSLMTCRTAGLPFTFLSSPGSVSFSREMLLLGLGFLSPSETP